MGSFGAAAALVKFGVVALFGFAGPIFDLAVRRKFHPAYYWGVGTILISMMIIPPLAFSPLGGAALALVQPLHLAGGPYSAP
ncbi:hypothetical protein [Novosphingobium sp. BL-52-GroH]|uniref:hypothetical protein n=1 Tax=Novosphingobium sp. BL-52-GroH TaxID=3349877 RepID=UPI00384FF168